MGGRAIIGALLCAAALAAASGASVASGAGEGPVSVTVGNEPLSFNGSFTPKALSRTTPQPVGLTLEAQIRTLDGTAPPALREVRFELDRSAVFDLAGREGTLLGRGELEFEVLDGLGAVRHAPFKVYGGIVRGGARVLPVAIGPRAGIGAPLRMNLRKVADGRYGYELRLLVSPAVEDRIRITQLALLFDDAKGVVAARCRDGKLQVHAEAAFVDGQEYGSEIVRACTPQP